MSHLHHLALHLQVKTRNIPVSQACRSPSLSEILATSIPSGKEIEEELNNLLNEEEVELEIPYLNFTISINLFYFFFREVVGFVILSK